MVMARLLGRRPRLLLKLLLAQLVPVLALRPLPLASHTALWTIAAAQVTQQALLALGAEAKAALKAVAKAIGRANDTRKRLQRRGICCASRGGLGASLNSVCVMIMAASRCGLCRRHPSLSHRRRQQLLQLLVLPAQQTHLLGLS